MSGSLDRRGTQTRRRPLRRRGPLVASVGVIVLAAGVLGAGAGPAGRPGPAAGLVDASRVTGTTTPSATTGVAGALIASTPAANATARTGGQGGHGGTTTTTSSPATTTTAAPGSSPPGSGTIGVAGGHLVLDGAPFRFVGVDAYELATQWGTNAGCGGMESPAQLDQLFSSLPPASLVRIWAFQGGLATDYSSHQLDWGPLDRVFAAAAAHGQRLILALGNQAGTCDNGHWLDPSWYQGGFDQVFDDPSTTDGRGLTPLSYGDYVSAVVTHFRSSPALGMWEPVNEPEASTCPGQYEPTSCAGHTTCPSEPTAAAALRHFYDVIGTRIHALDPSHLVEEGALAGGQCGTAGADYQLVGASPGIDVLSYHDYYGPTPLGGDQWNGLATRFAQASALGKPIIGGEVGLDGGTGSGCAGLAQRAADFESKLHAQLAAGSSGLLVWDWEPSATSSCDFSTYPGDPLLAALAAGPG